MKSDFIKALAISDTHGNKTALDQVAKEYGNEVEYIFHLGDVVPDAKYLKGKVQAKVVFVRGNCDGGGSGVPALEEVVIKGQRLVLTHGHREKVKFSMDRLLYLGQEKQAQAVLFGHTHQAMKVYENGIWLINPGSGGGLCPAGPSVAMLLIGEQGIVPKILRV